MTHTTPSDIALTESGLTGDEAMAARMEQTYMMNTEPGWRPSDAMRRACERVKARRPGSPSARSVLGL